MLMVWVFMIMKSLYAANISGTIKFSGDNPAPQILKLDADPTCASLQPEGLKSEKVVVNANGTLKNVFVYVKDGLTGKTFEPPKDPVVLDQKGCWYSPHVFGIQVNQPLEIRNSDATLHNVHGLAQANKEFNLGMPIQGMKLNKTFDKPEIMAKFKCDVHPWMSAYVGVVGHPFFNVSNEEGKFEIKNLPPGDYVLEAWHEKYGTQTQTIKLKSPDQTAEISFQYSATQ